MNKKIISFLKQNILFVGIGAFVIVMAGGVLAAKGEFSLASAFKAASNLLGSEPVHTEETGQSNEENAITLPIETVAGSGIESLGADSVSWAGEILSTDDIAVYPSREGQIAQWLVRIGQRVERGQVLGRLTTPPVSTEVASALAEKMQALVQARANTQATAVYIEQSKEQVQRRIDALERARQAAVQAADRNVQLLSESANVQAQSVLSVKQSKIRALIQEMLPRHLRHLTNDPINTTLPVFTVRYKKSVGALNMQTVYDFDLAIRIILEETKDPSAVPETSMLTYLKVAQKLVLATMSSDEISESELNDLRKDITEDQVAFLDALSEYKDAKIAAENARGERGVIVAGADVEYVKERTELEGKISELNRDLAIAQAEAEGAEAAYNAISQGLAGQNVIANSHGVISTIYKNVGDHVTPDEPIAAVSDPHGTGSFVRFQIPNDLLPPAKDSSVTIERPGFPFAKKKAKVVGVGTALDTHGSYIADAEFTEAVDWPIHASVRVMPHVSVEQTPFIPWGALWWDEAGSAHVWLVMENGVIRPQAVRPGRALGDRIEILEGLSSGDRYVAKATPDLKTGSSIKQSVAESPKKEEADAGGDGHGHEH